MYFKIIENKIQLFSDNNESISGKGVHWEGDFDCRNSQISDLSGAPETVGGSFDCENNQLKSLSGAPKTVGGDFDCRGNQLTSLNGAPETVGGSFDCENNQLKSLSGAPSNIGGFFDCRGNQLTSLNGAPETVGGSFDCRGNQLTSLNGAPSNVGGGFYCEDNPLTSLDGAPKVYDKSVRDIMQMELRLKGLLWADGIMAHILQERGNVFKVQVLGHTKHSWVVYDSGSDSFSHGDTLKQAKEDLLYKVSKRDVSEFKSWKLGTKRNVSDLISAYRSITGACSMGVKEFVKQNIDASKKYSVKDVFKIVNGAYGEQKFKSFFGV